MDIDVSTPEKLAAFMSESRSKDDWNRRCDIVKAACGGYPDYWFSTCIASGLINQILGQGSDTIKITGIRRGRLLQEMMEQRLMED